jgi:triacylglycerol lipase
MNSLAPTPQGRLLCACHCCYDITGTGRLDAELARPYFAGAGFNQPPATFVAGTDDIHGALVGTNQDGVIVAFRGTLPLGYPSLPALADWMNDFNAELVPGTELPGRVHAGFLVALDALWPALGVEVHRQWQAAGPNTALWITGHSKGGGIAPLAAMRLRDSGITGTVVTFAAPKAGDTAFAAAYNAAFMHTRWEYATDVVPHLPPTLALIKPLQTIPKIGPLLNVQCFEYEGLGTLRYIDRSGQVVGDSVLLKVQRIAELVALLARGDAKQVIRDHGIDCGTGYMNALCPGSVCY